MVIYLSDPASHHSHVLKNVFRYLQLTIKQKIQYGPGGAHEHELRVYTDADWAGNPTDRKSIVGGVYMFYGGPLL